MKTKLAQFINVLTVVPLTGLLVNTVVFLTHPAIFGNQVLWYLLSIIFITLIPMSAYGIKYLIPSVLEAGRRGERRLAFITALVGFSLGTAISWIGQAPRSVIANFSSYLATAVVLAVFNQFLHIRASAHAGGFTGPVSLLIYFMGGGLTWLALLFLPIIFWARLTTHRHTISELLTGTIIGFMVTGSVLFAFFGIV